MLICYYGLICTNEKNSSHFSRILKSNLKLEVKNNLMICTPLYVWVLSWISRCPGLVLDLKSSEPSLENLYLSQHYVLNVRLLTTALYQKHPAAWKTARNLVSSPRLGLTTPN